MLKVFAIGNLGKDCITNQVNGKNVINFNVAHTEKYKDRNGADVSKATWLECAYWTDRTGIAPYLKKGTQVFVEGIPEIKVYTRNDGTTGHSFSVRVSKIELLGAAKKEGGDSGSDTGSQYNTGNTNTSDISEPVDDLPF